MGVAMLATDLADYLVKRGIPFREAHELVGRAVLLSEKQGRKLSQLDYAELKSISPAFGPDFVKALDLEASVEAREAIGGTALSAVRAQLGKARSILDA